MLTREQQRALQQGRARAQREREREAVRRVNAFRRWLARGSKLREIPPVPSDADYVVWRREAAVSDVMKTIRIDGLVNGGPSAFDGEYVVEYDPCRDGVEPGSGRPMMCHLVTTPDVSEALQLSAADALELWRRVDARSPRRPDGRPNRPLTAFTVTIE